MTAVAPEQRRLAVPPRRLGLRGLGTAGLVLVVVVAIHWYGVHETNFSVKALVTGSKGMWQFTFGDKSTNTPGALPPDLSWSQTVKPALKGLGLTYSMGLIGTTFSVPVALVLALLGSRATSRHRVVYYAARGVMAFFRAIPSFIWGLIFVNAVGLGAFPGALAILVHNMGVMGKLWSEAMEETGQGPLEALDSAGANTIQRATHAVLPSALPQFSSLFLYRVDVNVRDALTMGLVGAGGLGQLIDGAISEFEFQQMATYLIVVLVMVFTLDLLSAWLRKRLAS